MMARLSGTFRLHAMPLSISLVPILLLVTLLYTPSVVHALQQDTIVNVSYTKEACALRNLAINAGTQAKVHEYIETNAATRRARGMESFHSPSANPLPQNHPLLENHNEIELSLAAARVKGVLEHTHGTGTHVSVDGARVEERDVSADTTVTECAAFSIPYNHSDPDASVGDIDMFTIRYRAKEGETAAKAIWIIPGGPGERASEPPPHGFYDLLGLGWAASGYDVFTMDLPGVGLSSVLGCWEEWDTGLQQFSSADRWFKCRDELEDNEPNASRLPYYTTSNYVRDLYAVMQSVNKGQEVFMLGFSYGTRVTNRFMTLYPDFLAGALIDGIAFGPLNAVRAYDENFSDVFPDFISACGEDSFCGPRLSLAGQDALTSVTSLMSDLIPNDNYCPEAFAASTFQSFSNFQNVIRYTMLQSSSNRFMIAPLLARVMRCSAEDITLFQAVAPSFLGQIAGLLGTAPQVNRDMNGTGTVLGMHMFVSANEVPGTPAQVAAELEATLLGEGIYSVLIQTLAQDWPITGDQISTTEYAKDTTTPILIFNGNLDPQTPVWNAEEASGELPTSTFVEFNNVVHGVLVFGGNCPVGIASQFFADPTSVASFNTSCAADPIPMDWEATALSASVGIALWPDDDVCITSDDGGYIDIDVNPPSEVISNPLQKERFIVADSGSDATILISGDVNLDGTGPVDCEDVIDLSAFSGVLSIEDIVLASDGENTIITITNSGKRRGRRTRAQQATVTITLSGQLAASVDSSSFVFAEAQTDDTTTDESGDATTDDRSTTATSASSSSGSDFTGDSYDSDDTITLAYTSEYSFEGISFDSGSPADAGRTLSSGGAIVCAGLVLLAVMLF
eukprot:TRINITY_DN3401_c0_g1_i1.p1 TRINITY_DN3401_c0_g1~~TRINITY_DN3401_c0_g1_i1.p1  ORF type:complete len:852 (-),score=134.89 TRINITY_DN3401_c0_g1_i1:112-2667(-)